MSIRIGILGYGNLGRGVEYAADACADMELAAVFLTAEGKKLTNDLNHYPSPPYGPSTSSHRVRDVKAALRACLHHRSGRP